MGLDLYAGTLTRYYTGQWETIIEQLRGAEDKPVFVMRPPGSLIDDKPAEVQRRILEWRAKLERDLGAVGALADPFDWPETMDQPYFTDKPDWNCFGAMILLAACTEAGVSPPDVMPTSWAAHRALQQMESRTGSAADALYPHLFFVEMWFPVSRMAVLDTGSPLIKPMRIASLPWLVSHLQDLNRRTFQIPINQIVADPIDVPTPEVRDFRAYARAGLVITLQIALKAREHRLPLVLDA